MEQPEKQHLRDTRAMFFDTARLPDAALEDLRRLTFERSCEDRAPLYSRWIHAWVDAVQAARAAGQHVGPFTHGDRIAIGHPELASAVPVCGLGDIPPASDWPNEEIAGALEAATALSFAARELGLAAWADRQSVFWSDVAADRLRGMPPLNITDIVGTIQ